ncbi:hypothetical protein FB45DRAFT_925377 [Roridomyces roridus]|uniref:Uncharacterized protein n=1 Tax=Roridomyces roridus TaxID=1738132 RepID=A0AAD7FJ20_9AGAR|nr:hypothetical protein FB45DRAFT_925377 [Roridomyces roridus]
MHSTMRLARQPLIQFLGKRSWPASPAEAHAHPAAPPDFRKVFTKPSSPTKPQSGSVFSEFWDAPPRFWRPRARELDESEIDAVLSGGASLR